MDMQMKPLFAEVIYMIIDSSLCVQIYITYKNR